MTSMRTGLLTGGLLAGTLLLGAVGSVAAQDHSTTPTPSPTEVAPGGMMGGQNGTGMMGGQNGASMMGTMSADQLKQMATLHDQMVQTGVCDPAQMQDLHAQLEPAR